MTFRTALVLTAISVLIGESVPAGRLQRAAAADDQAAITPVIVELFTSEGCSSCPPADTLLQKLVDTQPVGGALIVGLGEHVDYWDQLGWKDRFSSAALTDRQRLYAARFNNGSIYTPQIVVDGRAEFVGSDAGAARRVLDRASAVKHGVLRISVEPAEPSQTDSPGRSGHARVAVNVIASDLPALGRGDHADILLAVTEDHLRTDVKRGENHGRSLIHAAVVRQLLTIGEISNDTSSSSSWSSSSSSPRSVHGDVPLAADWQRDQLKVVAFVQERRSRTILASAVVPLARP